MKKLKLPIILLTIDLLTKAIAYFFLPFQERVFLTKDLYLYLTYNLRPYGTGLQNLNMTGSSTLVSLSLNAFIFGVIFLLLNLFVSRKIIRVAIYIAYFLLFDYLLNIFSRFSMFNELSDRTVSILKFIGPLFCVFTFLYYTQKKPFQILWSLMIAAGMGNLLNSLFPPFGVIDFVYSETLNSLFGIGILNFADFLVYIYMVMLPIVLLLSFIHYVAIFLKGRKLSSPKDKENYSG